MATKHRDNATDFARVEVDEQYVWQRRRFRLVSELNFVVDIVRMIDARLAIQRLHRSDAAVRRTCINNNRHKLIKLYFRHLPGGTNKTTNSKKERRNKQKYIELTNKYLYEHHKNTTKYYILYSSTLAEI